MSKNTLNEINAIVQSYYNSIEDQFNLYDAKDELIETALSIAGENIERSLLQFTDDVLENQLKREAKRRSDKGKKLIRKISDVEFTTSKDEIQNLFLALGNNDYLPFTNALSPDLEIVRAESNENLKKAQVANEQTNAGIDRLQSVMEENNVNAGTACEILQVVA